jgi:glutathione S-transferase
MAPPVILFDYPFSPYAKKIRLLFAAAGIPYKRCNVPMVLPRPTLLDLDITYRRIPVLAIGGDVYCDSGLIIDIIQEHLGGLPTSSADHAYEVFGNHIFSQGLSCIPESLFTEDFIKDRAPIFPICARKDFGTLGPSGKGEFIANLDIIERCFLEKASPFIGGSKPALADIHLIWVVSWVMSSLGLAEVPGCGKDSFPKLWKL